MALNLLVRYKILTNRSSYIQAGNYVNVYYDDVGNDIEVYKYDNASDTSGEQFVGGPDLGAKDFDFQIVSGISDPGGGFTYVDYRFCASTTLVLHFIKSVFPYVEEVLSTNHAQCQIATVCDLQISDSYTVTDASDNVTPDGSVTVTASSSNGTVKYSLDPNFNYSTQGQLTGVFTGMYSGTHVITAKDSAGCYDQIIVQIGIPESFGVKYRLEYDDINGNRTRVDIEERAFADTLEEVVGWGSDPFVLKYNGDGELNKFKPIIASEATLMLASTTNFKFRSLFTSDDRKYKLKYYKDTGSGFSLRWQGFVLPNNYQEPYIKHPYGVTIVATDGLADLKEVDFTDRQDRRYREDVSVMKAVSDILYRTGLNANIQVAVNRYEENMDQGVNDDPFTQCKFDPNTFYNDDNTAKTCFEALEEMLKPFAARVVQRHGKWFICSIEEHLSTREYREFDYSGTFISSGTMTDAVNFDAASTSTRAVFRGQDVTLETVPAYGTMYFEHTLLKNPSLIKGYGFEINDVIVDNNGFVTFLHWTPSIANAPGVTYGIKETKAIQGDFNFFLFAIDTTVGNEFTIRSRNFTIEYDENDLFEISFDYSVLLLNPTQAPYWIRLKWRLSFDEPGVDDEYRYIYVTSFNEVQTFRYRAEFPNGLTTAQTELAWIEFSLEGVLKRDAEISSGPSYTDLKAIVTTNRDEGYQIRAYYTAESPNNLGHWYYKLYDGDEAESLPEIVRPTDYNELENQKYWKRESVESVRGTVEYIYLDNVILNHYPGGFEPAKNITIEKPNSPNIKNTYEGKYLLNDIDTENINNAERTYKNFFKLLSGSPTQVWTRTYRAGEGKLLELLANDFASQYKGWSNKLTGSLASDVEVFPTTLMTETHDNDTKYIFMGYELHDKEYYISFDMQGLSNVLDDEGEDIDAAFTTGFSLGFRS